MTLFRLTTLLLLAAVFVNSNKASPGPETSGEKTPITIGVQILYDREVYWKIRDTRLLNQNIYNPSPSDYFAAFLEGVELRFRDIPRFVINMTLVNATLIDDGILPDIIAKAPTYGDALHGARTMTGLQKALQKYPEIYGRGDMVFYVTLKYIFTEENENKEWMGVAKSKGICSPENKVGLVTDDGKSFTGIEETAVQAALLLGATRDIENNCTEGDHLLSRLYGVRGTDFSSCSKEAIADFLTEMRRNAPCLENDDKIISLSPAILPTEYHDYFGYDICLAGYTGTRGDVKRCQPQHQNKQYAKPCRVQCCEYSKMYRKPFRLSPQKAADGTSCNKTNICIGGDCLEK